MSAESAAHFPEISLANLPVVHLYRHGGEISLRKPAYGLEYQRQEKPCSSGMGKSSSCLYEFDCIGQTCEAGGDEQRAGSCSSLRLDAVDDFNCRFGERIKVELDTMDSANFSEPGMVLLAGGIRGVQREPISGAGGY
jgi:hypothetical protein